MLKVGDKVRYIGGTSFDLTFGKVYEIHSISDTCYRVLDDVGDGNSKHFHKWEDASKSELDELRAFKAAALARFPALAEPETDDEAAQRFVDEMLDTEMYYDTVIEAFAWARSNPR